MVKQAHKDHKAHAATLRSHLLKHGEWGSICCYPTLSFLSESVFFRKLSTRKTTVIHENEKEIKMARMSPEVAKKALGLKNGRLAVCPQDMKNCVCSEYQDDFYIAPLRSQNSKILQNVIAVLSQEDGYELQAQKDDYLHYTYKSSILKFTDDIEFRLEKLQDEFKLHCRSASRLGYWDLGANKKRVTKLFEKIQAVTD